MSLSLSKPRNLQHVDRQFTLRCPTPRVTSRSKRTRWRFAQAVFDDFAIIRKRFGHRNCHLNSETAI